MRSKEELLDRVREAWKRDPFLITLGQCAPSQNKAGEAARLLGLDNEEVKLVADVARAKDRFPNDFSALLESLGKSSKEEKIVQTASTERWTRKKKDELWVALKYWVRPVSASPTAGAISPGTLVLLCDAGPRRDATFTSPDHILLEDPTGADLTWDYVEHPDVCLMTNAGYADTPPAYDVRAVYCATKDAFAGVASKEKVAGCPLCGRILA